MQRSRGIFCVGDLVRMAPCRPWKTNALRTRMLFSIPERNVCIVLATHTQRDTDVVEILTPMGTCYINVGWVKETL